MSSKTYDFTLRPVRTDKERRAALDIRIAVFVREQGIPEELEVDEHDDTALHLLAFDGPEPIATGRLLIRGTTGEIGRIAVLPSRRGRGVGSSLVRRLEKEGCAQGVVRFELTPHQHLEGFYSALGYTAAGDAGRIAGHPLIRMYKHTERSAR